MDNYKKQSKSSGKNNSILFGLLITLAGSLLLASNMGWVDSSIRQVLFSWQTIMVVFFLISLFQRNYFSALVFFALSVFFFLPKVAEVYPDLLPWINDDFSKNFWPIVIIVAGLAIVFGFLGSRKRFFGNKRSFDADFNTVEDTDGFYQRSVMFSGAEDVFLEPVFKGGKIEVIFGGVELDLRRTTLPEGDTKLKISAIFGGVSLHLPDDWKVITKVDAIFGGVERKRSHEIEIDSTRRLIIKGEVLFGGCEIH